MFTNQSLRSGRTLVDSGVCRCCTGWKGKKQAGGGDFALIVVVRELNLPVHELISLLLYRISVAYEQETLVCSDLSAFTRGYPLYCTTALLASFVSPDCCTGDPNFSSTRKCRTLCKLRTLFAWQRPGLTSFFVYPIE